MCTELVKGLPVLHNTNKEQDKTPHVNFVSRVGGDLLLYCFEMHVFSKESLLE